MGTVASVTTSIPLDYPSHATIARDSTTGYLYVFGRADLSNTYRVWRSTDGGSLWAQYASFVRTGLGEWSSIVIDKHKWLHIAYRYSDGTEDRLYYRRLNLTNATWSAELSAATDANGGVSSSVWQGVDLAVVRHPDGAYAIALAGTYTAAGSYYGVIVIGVSINADGHVYLNNGILTSNRSFHTNGTAPGRSTPACDIEHTGDGFTSSNPNLWVTWGRNRLYMVKLAWTGVGWQGPTQFLTIDSSIPGVDYVNGRWDGTRWMMSVIDSSDQSIADVYERNQANSQTVIRQTPQHPTGVIRTLGLSYDASNKNIRVFAVGTSTAVLYYVDFVRATSLWGSWTQVSADLIAAVPPDEFTMRRGGTTGTSKYDLAYTVGTSTPWTVKSAHLAQNYAPNTPTWDTSTQPYSNGGAADVGAALTLDWVFNDPDSADTQASYVLSRQIGAGTLSYWNAGSSTWGASEVFNSSATTAVTLASGWALAADAAYTFKVKTRDVGGLDSAFSAGLVLTPSTPVNPAITAPTAAQVLTSNRVTVTWTATEQKQFRIRLVTNPGSVLVFDSGYIADTASRSYVPAYDFPDGTGWQVWLNTTNNEGLVSATQTRAFTVDYTEPPVPTVVATPITASGLISVAITNPAPVGSQPALQSVQLWRRAAETYATLNLNPDFAGNVTSWTIAGGGTPGTLTYSTAQFVSSPGSGRYVPAATGGAAAPVVESSPVTIDVTRSVVASAWIRPDTANKPITVGINWYTSGNAYLSNTVMQVSAPVAGVWHYLTVVGDPGNVSTAAKAGVAVGLTGTPASADAIYIDEVRLRVWNPDEGTRVASELASGSTVLDWKTAARTPYEYQAVVYGANGTFIRGAWTS